MITENSVTYQFVGNANYVANLTQPVDTLPEGATAIVGTINGQRGERILANAGIANGTRVRVAQRINGNLVFSPYFVTGGATRVTTQTFVSPREQLSFLGWNGTGGQLDAERSREYNLGLHLYHTQGVFNNTPMIKSIPAWVGPLAGAGPGQNQFDLATALFDSLQRQFRRAPRDVVKGERVFDGVVANPAGLGRLALLTNGSPNVTFVVGGAAGVVASTQTFVAGDVLSLPTDNGRVFTFSAVALGNGAGRHLITIGTTVINVPDAAAPGTAAENATAIAAAINASAALAGNVTAIAAAAVVTITYDWKFKALPPVVVSSDDDAAFVNVVVTTTVGNAVRAAYVVPTAINAGATAVLDRPWNGPTGYVAFREAGADAANHAGRTATANAIGAANNWGLMLKGNTSLLVNEVTETPAQVEFKMNFTKIINAGDNGIEPVVLSTFTDTILPFIGIGTGAQVAVKEVYSTMNEGQPQVCAYPPTKYRKAANLGSTYNLKIINAVDANYIVQATGQNPISKFNIILAIDSTLTAANEGWTVINAQLP
jgi:hypothetical protein